jgi:hypothetical protein
VTSAVCSVLAVFDAVASAELVAVWLAVLDPPVASSPAICTGTFAFTAFCGALAFDLAFCSVAASCSTFCRYPLPPQAATQLDPPPDWLTSAVWSVVAPFEASDVAELVAVWLAVLDPPVASSPATCTGTFAFTAFCGAVALASAPCAVAASWVTSCR